LSSYLITTICVVEILLQSQLYVFKIFSSQNKFVSYS